MKTTNWKECLQRNLPTNIFASLVVRKISKPNHISSFYGKFIWPVFFLKISCIEDRGKKADTRIGRMMCLRNHDLHHPKRFGLTAQWVSAALQREDQTCTRTWRTWPKSYDFADLPPHLKGAKIRWRQFTFSLELTLVFEARDLNSVILQMVRSMIWRNLDEGNSI